MSPLDLFCVCNSHALTTVRSIGEYLTRNLEEDICFEQKVAEKFGNWIYMLVGSIKEQFFLVFSAQNAHFYL